MVHVGKFWNCWLVIWCSFFLVGALEHGFYFSIYWEFIIPTDELIFFRWVIPPTSYGSCFFLKPDNGWSNSYLRVTSYHCQPCLFISTHGVRKDPKQIFKMVFQSFLSFSLWFSRWVFPFRRWCSRATIPSAVLKMLPIVKERHWCERWRCDVIQWFVGGFRIFWMVLNHRKWGFSIIESSKLGKWLDAGWVKIIFFHLRLRS